MERETALSFAREIQKPEILRGHYQVLVIDPYSINLKTPEKALRRDPGLPDQAGEVRLSFYSAFVDHVAREIIEDGLVDEVVVFDDASFGEGYISTGDLTIDYLTGDRIKSDGNLGSIIDKGNIIPFKGKQFARTPTQVQAVANYVKEKGLAGQEVLYLGWDYHRERVLNHAKGFGLSLKYASAEQIHKYYEPDFELEKLLEILPIDEIENMEEPRRRLSRRDKKGLIPGVIQSLPFIGGPRMLDNKRNSDGSLSFDYRRGISRVSEFGLK